MVCNIFSSNIFDCVELAFYFSHDRVLFLQEGESTILKNVEKISIKSGEEVRMSFCSNEPMSSINRTTQSSFDLWYE